MMREGSQFVKVRVGGPRELQMRIRVGKGTKYIAVSILAAVLGTLAAGSQAVPVLAYASCNLSPNRYAHETTGAGNYNGLYAQFTTWVPFVNNVNTDFTLSHDYLYVNGGFNFVETGVYHGYGTQVVTSGAYFYVAWRGSDSVYNERDDFAVSYGTVNSYEIVYNSYDPTSQRHYYDLLFNGTRREQVYNNSVQASGYALFGGETTSTSGNRIIVSGQAVELQTTSHAWMNVTSSDWQQTTGDSISTCTDPNVGWTYSVQWNNYTVDGYIT
jgi:hypothetical protein